jgi:hypothetical protein
VGCRAGSVYVVQGTSERFPTCSPLPRVCAPSKRWNSQDQRNAT